jgi:integrase
MQNSTGEGAKSTRKVVFHWVAENLYRLDGSGGYYALLKRGDKQFRRSLRTKDRKLADRRLAEMRSQVTNLRMTEDARLSFKDIADRWIATTSHALKENTVKRRQSCIANVVPFFAAVSIRNVQPHHCERWLTERGAKKAAQTMAHELNTMRSVFDYAVQLGLMLSNPAKDIKRRKVVQQPVVIPTKEQFRNLIAQIRDNDGRPDSQAKAKPGADLVELLAYSGCRVHEAVSMKWADVNFAKGTVTVTGGERGTKNHEQRTIPMTDALRSLLSAWQTQRKPKSEDFVSSIDSAKKCLQTACRHLKYRQFTHHDFRHFFATTCIESGVDIPTVSRWLGHKDGGALAMRVYGHLRDEHSSKMISRVRF